jgi:hypothetical protein
MKKFILFVIIVNLFAGSINDTNSTHKIIVGYKKNFIDKINYFIPDFLKISTETSFVNIRIYEDTLTQKTPSASVGINIKLPEIFVKKIKTKNKNVNNAKKKEYSSIIFKLRPFIRIKKHRIFFFQNIIEYKKTYLNNEFGISNKINYYPFENYWEENINFAYFKHLKNIFGANLNISTDKENFPTKYYSLNFSVSNFKRKFISSYGYEIGGNTDNNPFIYYHKLFINFRKTLFNKKYIYLELMPYFLISKDYDFKLKPAVSSSINIKF